MTGAEQSHLQLLLLQVLQPATVIPLPVIIPTIGNFISSLAFIGTCS